MKSFLLSGAIVIAAATAFGLGADHPNGCSVEGSSAWPGGLRELVNVPNRVHGYFVNAEDIFFFSGGATNLSDFLRDYSKIQDVKQHLVVLHDGVGEARSPWSKTGKPCDWQLYAAPKSWLAADAKERSFVLEVHLWTGGKIALDQLAVPTNVEFAGDCLKVFESITNGMTRAEVESKFALDGGLQGVSPVRFAHSSCPKFKVNVEFDFKRNAADQGRAVIAKDDKVIRISKPYVERAFMD